MKYILIIAVSLFCHTLPAQTQQEYNEQLVKLVGAGEYQKAIPIGLDAAEYAYVNFGNESNQYATALNNLGYLNDMIGKLTDAEMYYSQALRIRKKILDPGNDDYITTAQNMASLYVKLKKYREALEIYQPLAEQAKKKEGEFSREYAELLGFVAATYEGLGKKALAEKNYLQAVQIYRSIKEADATLANSLYNLAEYYSKHDSVLKAESTFIELIGIREKLYGVQHIEYMQGVYGLAILYTRAGMFAKAEPFMLKTLEYIKATKGENDPGYFTNLENLANIYAKTNQFEKAELLWQNINGYYLKNYGDTSRYYGSSLDKLMNFYKERGQHAKALVIAGQVLSVYRGLPKQDPLHMTAMANMAVLYVKTGQYRKAETLFLEVCQLMEANSGKEDPSCMKGLATLYGNLGEYDKSEAYLLKAMRAWETMGKKVDIEYVNALKNLATLYQRKNQYGKVEPLLINAIEILNKTGKQDSHEYPMLLNSLGSLYHKMYQYTKAEQFYLQALEKQKLISERTVPYAEMLADLGELYGDMNQFNKGEELFFQGLELIKSVVGTEHPSYTNRITRLAAMYQDMGQYEKVEPLYLEAIAIEKGLNGNESVDYAAYLGNLGYLYQLIGQSQKAEQLYLEVLEITRKVPGPRSLSYALVQNNLAQLYDGIRAYEKADTFYNRALKTFSSTLGNEHADYALVLNNLGALYVRIKKYPEAQKLFEEALAIRKKIFGVDHPEYAGTLNNLASLYEHLGQHAKAEELMLRSSEIWEKSYGKEHPYYSISLSNLALLYQQTGQFKKSEAMMTEYNKVEIRNLLRVFSTLSEKEKGNYIANNLALNSANNSLLYLFPAASPAFYEVGYNLQLFVKSLSLSDTKNSLESIRNSRNTIVKQLFTDWQLGKAELSAQYSLPVTSRRKDLKKLEENSEDLEKQLNRRSAAFRGQQKILQVTGKDVLGKLAKDEAVVEFVSFRLYNGRMTDSIMYAAYVLRNGYTVPVFVPLCEEKQLRRLFDSVGNSAQVMANSFYRGIGVKNNNESSLGNELYKLVWQPLEAYLKGINKIAYSPTGKLFSVAFHALRADSGSLLMDKYQLQQYTSTRQVALRATESETIRPKDIVLFGNPRFTMDSTELASQRTSSNNKKKTTLAYLAETGSRGGGTWNDLPGTKFEVNAIQSLFNKHKIKAGTFTETSASEEKFKALDNGSPQVLHIATHGFFLPPVDTSAGEKINVPGNTYSQADDPLMRSGLVFSGGNYAWSGNVPVVGVEDGIATSYEISQLNLSNTELLVLSACETALGDIKGSEGVFGLQRAFKMAGVQKMIVSLWQVPDKETAELMTAFYSYWIKGELLKEAFIHAQADMRKKYTPFYWAAFVLVE